MHGLAIAITGTPDADAARALLDSTQQSELSGVPGEEVLVQAKGKGRRNRGLLDDDEKTPKKTNLASELNAVTARLNKFSRSTELLRRQIKKA